MMMVTMMVTTMMVVVVMATADVIGVVWTRAPRLTALAGVYVLWFVVVVVVVVVVVYPERAYR